MRLNGLKIALVAIALLTAACKREPSDSVAGASGGEVVIYSSIDEPYLRPLMQKFQKESGITVRIVTDTEATKSAGLVERLIAEKDHPQADVYWGNEIFHTINMAEAGAFDAYKPTTATDIPAKWRDKNDLYVDVGLRARMLVISTRPENKTLVAPIKSMSDLAHPALKGKIAISHPAFGTASGHVAALYQIWGEQKFADYMKSLKANDIKLLGGNSAVVTQVAAGTLAAGPTDNDDINNAKADGQQVEGVLPDQGPSDAGTLLIPGTVALLKNCQHPDNAKKLIDFICKPEIEKELISGRYLGYSVRDTSAVKVMDVDYVKAAHDMKHAVELALTILQQR